MPLLAPPHLFAAVGLAADDDPDLPRGTHLRLLPSPLLGFPVAPFGVLRLEPFVNEEPHVDWRDREGGEVPTGDLDAAGGLLVATILELDGDDGVTVAVEVRDGFEGVATLLDREDRVLTRRSAPPWVLGAPRVERLRLEGRGQASLRLWRVNLGAALDVPFDRWDIEPLSLPIDGTRPWYVGGLGADPAMDRVRSGAAMRLGPPDQADGPFDPIPPEDELLRVGLHLPEIVRHCEAMLSDPATTPRRVALEVPPQVEADGVHSAELKVEGTLLLQAMDPGIGRCLGLVTRLDPPPDPAVPTVYAACGIFAVDPKATAPGAMTLGQALGAADDAFLDLVMAVVTRPRGDNGELGRLREQINGAGMEMRLLVALAAAVPAPDRPETSVPDLQRARWLDGGGGVSQAFRQDLVWPDHALGALVALGRHDNGGWTTQHRPVDLPAEARIRRRYLPMLMGRTIETPHQMPKGLLSVAPVPAATPPVTFRVATADLFGRFGPPAEFPVPPPPRPAPPRPAPQLQVEQDGPVDGSAEAVSPGHVVVTVPVPGVDRLAAGALPIAQVEIALDGAWQPPLPAPPAGADGLPGAVSLSLPMPPTLPGKTTRALVSVRFRDSDGTPTPEKEAAVLPCACTDRRHPPVPQVGKGLIWTSRPGPAPDVEIALSWPVAEGGRYRAFIADAASLGLSGPSRAAIAVAAGNGEGAGLTDRKSFRLLTDPPVEARTGGRAELRETLPRSLAGVQVLRIVPVSETGREAPFADCPAVAVAVPSDRRPPPPRVTVRLDPATGRATIRVVALGLDQVALRDAEPGLFASSPDPAARPPEFRLRRAAGAVADPFYARVIKRVAPLEFVLGTQDGEEGKVFMAEFEDPDPLPPFLPVSYFAEVRMPAERRIPPGPSELPPDGGIEPLSTAQVEDMPGLFSPFSAPAMVTHAPTPNAPEGLAAELVGQPDGNHLRLTWAEPPRLHPKLGQSYALRVWTRWQGAAIEPVDADIPLDAVPFAWDGPAVAAPSAATVFAALVDPLGRMGPTVEMNVAPPG